MQKRTIMVEAAPPAAGPYSHACAAGNMLYCSGQIALAPDGSGYTPMPVADEARLALDNLARVLEGCGSGLEHVVKTMWFLDDINDFATFNEVYAEYFGEHKPARSCVQAGKLPLNAKVEVEAIAILPDA